MAALTRGPLPARVYWTRRLMLLGTAFLLVLGLARVLNAGSDASSEESPPEQALQAAATPSSQEVGPEVTEASRKQKPRRERTPKEPVLAQPDGPCADSDIAVTPQVKNPVAGREVFIVLELRTIEAAACTWQVSPETLTVKITSGKDDIWSSRQCPKAIRSQSVVVRQAVTSKVGLTWSGRRSDEECTRQMTWALPGWYHVAAAAFAGEPSDLQFELEEPKAQVVVKTVKPEPKKDRDRNGPRTRNDGRPKHR